MNPTKLLKFLFLVTMFNSLCMAAMDAHVFRDTDGDGWLNDCPNHDADGDGLLGPADELDAATCSGAEDTDGRFRCRDGDGLDLDADDLPEVLYSAIHLASNLMTGPEDRVSVHEGIFGDIDADGVVEQQTTFDSMLMWFDTGNKTAECVASINPCPGCLTEEHRRILSAAELNGTRDAPTIDLGNAVPTAFGAVDPRFVTIRGFHIIRQDMNETYGIVDNIDGVKRAAIELWCPNTESAPTYVEIRENIIDSQEERMAFEPHRAHLHNGVCSYLTIDSNRFESEIYYNVKSIYGNNHHTITNNIFRADNDVELISHNVAYALYLNGNNGNVIKNNYFYRHGTRTQGGSAGLRLRNFVGPEPTLVEGNVVRGWLHCMLFQMERGSSTANFIVSNNTCVSDGSGTAGASALLWTDARVIVRNNVIDGFRSIFQGTPEVASVGYNLVHDYERIFYYSNTGTNVTWEGGDVCGSNAACGGTEGMLSDCQSDGTVDACNPWPAFRSTGERPAPFYHLTAGSPAVDAGFDGNCAHEISGRHCDIGAFEYSQVVSPPADVTDLHRTDTTDCCDM